jgi:hypothetical protein
MGSNAEQRVSSAPKPAVRDIAWFVPLALVGCIGYALYTGHVWEDYLITFRFSKNLVEGHGLVYNLGERIHGFTSPLGVLLPALGYWLTGNDQSALWFFRVLSIAAFLTGGVLALTACRCQSVANGLEAVFFGVLLALDVKAIGFVTNGMETGLMMLFLGWSFFLLADSEGDRWLARGLCWAGFMWTRPDGCIYIAAFGLIELLIKRDRLGQAIASLLRSAVLCALLYLPWFLFTLWYYHTPVPHTIVAKTDWESMEPSLWSHLWQRLYDRGKVVFAPTNYAFGGMRWVGWLSCALCVFCAVYWLFPLRDRLGRAASLFFLCLAAYLVAIPFLFAWYLPPLTMCGLVVLARGIPRLFPAAMPMPSRAFASAAIVLALAGAFGYEAYLGANQIRIQQSVIEDQNRTQVGLWLKDHVRPNERVYLEPLGYIGYFSNARMMDYPGLVCDEVVEARCRGENFWTMVGDLKPEWLVLRPDEAREMDGYHFLQAYRFEQKFDVSKQVKQLASLPGVEYLQHDAVYYIFKRRS